MKCRAANSELRPGSSVIFHSGALQNGQGCINIEQLGSEISKISSHSECSHNCIEILENRPGDSENGRALENVVTRVTRVTG